MSQYAVNNLSRDEALVVKAKKTPKCLIPLFVRLAIIMAIAIVLTVLYGAANLFKSSTYSFNRTVATIIVENEYLKEFDNLSDEDQQFMLALEEVSSRSELKEKLIDQQEKSVEKQSLDLTLLGLEMRYGISKTQVYFQFFLPFLATIFWISFAIGILQCCSNLSKFLSTELVVTNKRVFGRIGMFRRSSIDIYIDKVNQVEIKETFMGNLLNYASVRVKSIGNDNERETNEVFMGIRNAKEIKDRVLEMIEKHAENARKMQAQELAQIIGNQEPQN